MTSILSTLESHHPSNPLTDGMVAFAERLVLSPSMPAPLQALKGDFVDLAVRYATSDLRYQDNSTKTHLETSELAFWQPYAESGYDVAVAAYSYTAQLIGQALPTEIKKQVPLTKSLNKKLTARHGDHPRAKLAEVYKMFLTNEDIPVTDRKTAFGYMLVEAAKAEPYMTVRSSKLYADALVKLAQSYSIPVGDAAPMTQAHPAVALFQANKMQAIREKLNSFKKFEKAALKSPDLHLIELSVKSIYGHYTGPEIK